MNIGVRTTLVSMVVRAAKMVRLLGERRVKRLLFLEALDKFCLFFG